MGDLEPDGQGLSTRQQYRTLLAVSQAIVSQRDLHALFHDLAGRLRQVVRFDYLTLVLYEAATNTMRMHVLEPAEPTEPAIVLAPEEDPAGLVWQTQQPLVTSRVAELTRWPRLLERVQPYGVESFCWLPLTTARRRLGALVFTSKQPCAYDTADMDFLQQVANQVAVAVENALAFQEIEALNHQLHQENVYLERSRRSCFRHGPIKVGHGEVGDAVALEVPHCHGIGPSPSAVVGRGREGAVASAQEHADVVAIKVGYGRHRHGTGPDRKIVKRWDGTTGQELGTFGGQHGPRNGIARAGVLRSKSILLASMAEESVTVQRVVTTGSSSIMRTPSPGI